MSKLGMVVLWCIVIIYGIGVITHICSDIIGVVVLVVLAVVSIAFELFAKRYKIFLIIIKARLQGHIYGLRYKLSPLVELIQWI